MPLKKIVTYGIDSLKEPSKTVENITDNTRRLINDMADTMYETHGVGLAAPQIGVNLKIAVIDIDYSRKEKNNPGRNLRVFINPQIVWESDEDGPFNEGCLSVPDLDGEVYRPLKVKVNYRDEHFKQHTIEADGLLARVLQHEIDHLNGYLFVDRLSFLKRKMLAGQLHRLKKITRERNASSEK